MIRSARLHLSRFTMADAEEVFECITPAIARFMRWEPPKSLNEYKAYREARLQANDPLVFSFVVRRSDTMECLGIAGVDEADQPTPELGIWPKEAAHGHGYGTEAIKAVAEWATKTLAKESFLYPVAVENVASRRIAEKLNGEIVGSHTNPPVSQPTTRIASLTIRLATGASLVEMRHQALFPLNGD
jgi:RimJ/RimL family protein N-acetyltransferase